MYIFLALFFSVHSYNSTVLVDIKRSSRFNFSSLFIFLKIPKFWLSFKKRFNYFRLLLNVIRAFIAVIKNCCRDLLASERLRELFGNTWLVSGYVSSNLAQAARHACYIPPIRLSPWPNWDYMKRKPLQTSSACTLRLRMKLYSRIQNLKLAPCE